MRYIRIPLAEVGLKSFCEVREAKRCPLGPATTNVDYVGTCQSPQGLHGTQLAKQCRFWDSCIYNKNLNFRKQSNLLSNTFLLKDNVT